MNKKAKFTRSVVIIAAVFAVGSLVETVQAATTFTPPNAGAPKTRIGGGVRGGLWVPPNAGAPKTRIGGGVRGVNLVLPKVGAPKTRVGGGVRGANWTPPVAGAPKTRVGGGVRGANLILPKVGAPKTRIGGGVRGLKLPVAGAPKTRIGGGVRGNDVELLSMPKLAVLTPEQTGYTTQASPSLYYYVSEDTQLEFEFTLNKNEQTLFETRVTTYLEKGINQVSLKELGLKLDEGVEYEWNVAVIPDPTQGSLDVTSTGTIKRVKAQKKMANYEEYAENGIWYDMLEDLNGKIEGKPADDKLRKERVDLLKQVGLTEVSQFEMSAI
jgi:hypothetical protein